MRIAQSVEELSRKSLTRRFIDWDDDKDTIAKAKEDLNNAIKMFQVCDVKPRRAKRH